MIGRLVVIACAYAFRNFVGLDCYDIDNNTFVAVWAKDIHKYNIWGIDKTKVRKKWVSENEKVCNVPIIKDEKDLYNQGFDNFSWLRGYKHLPYIDVRTGEAYNLDFCVIVSKFVENGKVYYRYIKSTDRSVCSISDDYLKKSIQNRSIYFCNIKNYYDRITPLYDKFFEETYFSRGINDIKNKTFDKLEKLKENDIIKFGLSSGSMNKETLEKRRDFNRRFSVMRNDITKYSINSKDEVELALKNREFFMNTLFKSSNVILPKLQQIGLNDIHLRKKTMQSVTNYIDSSSKVFLDELDSFEQFPCLDKYCSDFLKYIKRNFNYASIDARAFLIKQYFYNNFKKSFIGICSKCYTMMSLYAMAYFQERKAAGFSILSFNNENFVNVENRYIYSLKTFFITVHEYIHYLSNNVQTKKSGFNSKDEFKLSENILTEGFTDLLACYFTEYILNIENKDNILLLLGNKKITKKDYSTIINPFLIDITSLKKLNFEDIESITSKTMVAYKYNVCLVFYILNKLDCKIVFEYFFNQDKELFFNLCEKEFGKDVWNDFIDTANSFSEINIGYSEYIELLDILKGETLC